MSLMAYKNHPDHSSLLIEVTHAGPSPRGVTARHRNPIQLFCMYLICHIMLKTHQKQTRIASYLSTKRSSLLCHHELVLHNGLDVPLSSGNLLSSISSKDFIIVVDRCFGNPANVIPYNNNYNMIHVSCNINLTPLPLCLLLVQNIRLFIA